MGRGKPCHALAGPGQGGQGRQSELQLADAFLAAQDLGQRAGGPAAAGEFLIKHLVTG